MEEHWSDRPESSKHSVGLLSVAFSGDLCKCDVGLYDCVLEEYNAQYNSHKNHHIYE